MTEIQASPDASAAAGDRPSSVLLHSDGAIAEIALDGGPLNLVTAPLLRSLNGALRDVAAAQGIRCLIVHGGSGRAFCAGSDIREFAHLREDASERKILFEDMVLRTLASMAMPTIAAIDGPALGGGFELALAWGLVNRVVDGSALDGARALATEIAARGPLSNRHAKKLVDAAQDLPLDAALSLSTGAQQAIFDSRDLHEGVAAFFAKRPPTFEGR